MANDSKQIFYGQQLLLFKLYMSAFQSVIKLPCTHEQLFFIFIHCVDFLIPQPVKWDFLLPPQ